MQSTTYEHRITSVAPPIVNTGKRIDPKTTAPSNTPIPKKAWEQASTKTSTASDPNFPSIKDTSLEPKTATATKVSSVASASIQTDAPVRKENPWSLRKQQNEIADIFKDVRI